MKATTRNRLVLLLVALRIPCPIHASAGTDYDAGQGTSTGSLVRKADIDTVKPTVVHAERDGHTVLVRFSEPVNQAQAEDLRNYSIASLSMAGAYLTNGTDLIITLNPEVPPKNYTLTIGGIEDLAPVPNMMNTTSLLMHTAFAIFGGITAQWRLNASGQDLGTNWYAINYPEEAAWPIGEQVFYAGEDPATKQWPFAVTQLPLNITSAYFRIHFNYPYDPAGATLKLQLCVDDGCVIYLNGREATRFLMPEGPVTANTFAISHESPNGDPAQWDIVEIPTTSLVQGNNVLAVSVHQASAGDSDMAFGAQLLASTWPIGVPVPVRFIAQPQSITTNTGASVTLSVVAVGTAPLQYQWFFNTVWYPGKTNDTLVLNNVQFGNSGDYHVVVANAAGSFTSAVARLLVQDSPPPGPTRPPEFPPLPPQFGGPMVFPFVSEANFTYSLEFTPTLNPIHWQPVPGQTVQGDGTVRTLSDPDIRQPQRFYRLRVD